mmetsp:Transcript_16397/g.20039  ORF Transcript_16397/g.20039 Transcript_16397/m.20039 type:complete len:280 (+) Transcript_16397:43-882(+)
MALLLLNNRAKSKRSSTCIYIVFAFLATSFLDQQDYSFRLTCEAFTVTPAAHAAIGGTGTRTCKNAFALSSSFSSANAAESLMTITEATETLSQFDKLQLSFIKSDGNKGLGGGTSALTFIQTQLSKEEKQKIRSAAITLVHRAHEERSQNQAYGRIMLGICAENVTEGLMGLKTWVDALSLPRGLLHGLDVDGKPMENPDSLGSIYLKYNTGGCMTFTEMRRSKMGFDGLWRPGDVVLETYDGDFRGIYLNIELEDGIFRQFGVLPTDLFLEEDEEDW